VRPSFLQGVAERTQAAGALLIADEVLTGFGRTGELFACRRAGLAPDLVALSKGLTGGFLPMSVTLASEALHESFCGPDPASTFFHGHSFTANPLGCAAALASLDLLEADPDRPRHLERLHRQRLQILAGHPLVRRPRLLGTIAAFDLLGPSGYLQPAGRELQRLCLAQGVYLRPLGSVVYLMPPLVITAAELDRCYGALQQGLTQLNPG
jgi:adenosylmethionine-8-amino-7-oxononanoate aminotransferase